jgi:tetratricopeptide (TPR) repeat protein
MDPSPSKPSRIGAYDIIDVIGRGGMGTVFRGNDPRIGRQVAIKMLTAAAEDPDLLIRFYREAKYTGSLHHQNIVTVYELGHQDGVPYLVMEYLEGVSLEAVISSGRVMSMAEKLGVILQVCSGLTYAHRQSLVHRDIKPANIMILPDGTAKIVDFGIALLGGSRLTRTGHVVGSLNYMSPEQLSGNIEVDVRTDVYSTGVVLFQMLTGVLPFDGGSTAATLRRIVQDPPPPLSQYLEDCPAELEGILHKALLKDREERYSSPEDFSLDLQRVYHFYLQKMVGETLQRATEALQRKDYASARQQVLQVLRGSPQSMEALELLKLIKLGQEQQQHEQQILHWQMKAEEAFRKNNLDEALRYAEQGMRLDQGGTVFPELRSAIMEAQARMGRYREALKRAETALRAWDLETAKLAVEEAQAILPDDPGARTLAGQIITRLEQQLREQKDAEKQREFARSLNAVEKGMADARMLILLGQAAEALQALENFESAVAQLPPQWVEQFRALKKEARDKRDAAALAVPPKWAESFDGRTAEIPAHFDATPEAGFEARSEAGSHAAFEATSHGTFDAAFDATSVMQSGVGAEPPGASAEAPPRGEEAASFQQPETTAETAQFVSSGLVRDVFSPRAEERRDSRSEHEGDPGRGREEAEVAPELREFLEPEARTWPRPAIWIGIAIVLMVVVMVWLFARPSPESHARPPLPVAAGPTYAEINAEPWAMVTAVDPASGDAASVIGQATPLRVKLPPGQYKVTLQGPNRESKQVDVIVPASGGVSCFALFKKPDLNRIVGR